jgi:hypothetical protein
MKSIGYIRLANGKKLYITSIEFGDYDPTGTKKQDAYLLGNNESGRTRMLKIHDAPDKRLYVVVDGQKYYEEQWVRTTDWDK